MRVEEEEEEEMNAGKGEDGGLKSKAEEEPACSFMCVAKGQRRRE